MTGALCVACHAPVLESSPRIQALDALYHADCFRCIECGRVVRDGEQYAAFKVRQVNVSVPCPGV
jgi:uncharacterized protein with PIN domain